MSVSGVRTASVQLSLAQLAVVGLGTFCIANPDKFVSAVQKSIFLMSDTNQGRLHQQQSPIIIHQGSSAGSSKSLYGFVIQLALGASVCWGSYVVLTNALPEAAKGLLPVTNNVFNRAVTSLGSAVINLKDTLMEQVLGLSQKQDELSDKQEQTHGDVLEVKSNVADLKGDLGLVQESLDLCHATLSESERRTSYIARGVQLLTRSVSSVLSESDSGLMNELIRFSTEGRQFNDTEPLDQLQDVLTTMHTRSQDEDDKAKPRALTFNNRPKAGAVISPENEHPQTPSDVERSVLGVQNLLESVRCYKAVSPVY